MDSPNGEDIGCNGMHRKPEGVPYNFYVPWGGRALVGGGQQWIKEFKERNHFGLSNQKVQHEVYPRSSKR